MDLEQMQATWSELSAQLEQQKRLTKQIILQMTQERYSNKFKTISFYETIGAVVCFMAGLYILINMPKLDTWYLMACGIFTLLYLIVMPILVLRALYRIKSIDILKNNYKETLVEYGKSKKYLLMLQQFGIYACFILMFTTAAIFSKIWSNKDFFNLERNAWVYGAIALAVLFVFFFARWGYRCYKSITASAEEVIKELE